LRPALCAAPFVALLLLRSVSPDLRGETQASLIAAATLGAALLFWNYGLVGAERQKLAHALRQL
jgi:hypothetical protein